MSNTPYEYDENDPALKAVKDEEAAAITESDSSFNSQIAANNKEKEGILDKIDANTQTQIDAQNKQTEFVIQGIEQEKEYAKKDYIKEQSGAYTDWQKQSNAYGVNAEQRAASGMTNTGYSESSQVSMYNAYQNRVAVARESYNRTIVSYNQSIAQAKMQNSVALAEIANNALAQSLEVTMNYATMNNNLFTQKISNRNTIKNTYMQKWAAVLDELYKEAALAEQARQHDETLAEQRRQFNEEIALEQSKFAWQKEQASSSGGGSGGGNGGGKIDKDESGGSSGGSGIDKTSSGGGSSSKTSEATPNMASVLALGYGPISAAKLNELVESGQVVEIEKDGQLYYSKRFVG
jgi:hypothetical protein